VAWIPYRFSGYAPDIPADALPAEFWTVLANAQTRDGVAERAIGDQDKAISATPICRWEHAVACNTNANVSGIVYGGDDYAGPRARVGTFYVGIGHVDITPGAWAATATGGRNYWTGGQFSTGVLLNDVTHDPIWVSSASAVTVLTATNFNALRPYKYMAIGIGDKTTAGAENTVRWSASVVPGAAPNVWAPAAGNDAGDVDISAPSYGYLIDGGRCGEDFLIYGENSTHLMTYVGGATVMATRSLAASSGIMARNCWADIGGAHVVLTKDDVVLVGPQGIIKSIADNRVRRDLFSGLYNADGRQLSSQVWYDRRRGRVYIALPKSSPNLQLTFAYVWEVATDTWSVRSLSNTSGTPTTDLTSVQGSCMASLENAAAGNAQPRMVVLGRGEPSGALADAECHYLDSNDVRSSVQAGTIMQKDDLDLGDASRLKVVQGLRLRGTAGSTSVTLLVKVGVKNALTESYTYSAEQSWVMPTTQFIPFLVTGRWVSVSIRCADNTDVQYRIHGFDIQAEMGGAW
jgi:hypothetical protein